MAPKPKHAPGKRPLDYEDDPDNTYTEQMQQEDEEAEAVKRAKKNGTYSLAKERKGKEFADMTHKSFDDMVPARGARTCLSQTFFARFRADLPDIACHLR